MQHTHPLVDVIAVRVLERHVVELMFDDGAVTVRDLGLVLRGPVFEVVLDDDATFRAVRVDPDRGTVCWPNGADLDPEMLRYDDLWQGEVTASARAPVRARRVSSRGGSRR
jgi:hypothetical protein